jgi:hypothetical protein
MDNPRKTAFGTGAIVLLGVGILVVETVGSIPGWVSGVFVLWMFSVLCFLWADYLLGRTETLEGASKARPGSVSSGLVHVTGTAAPAADGETLTAGDEDREVLAYRSKVTKKERVPMHERDRDPFNRQYKQETVEDVTEVTPFYVEGEDGAVLVDADHAELDLEWDEDPMGAGQHWAYLEPGDDVTVFGTAMSPEDRSGPAASQLASGLTDATEDRVPQFEEMQEKMQEAGMEAGDLPEDAPSPEEQRQAIEEAREKAQERTRAGRKASVGDYAADEEIILSRANENDVLFVAEEPPDDVVSGKKWTAYGIGALGVLLFAGPVVAAIAVFL